MADSQEYSLRIYVEGMPGYFTYEVTGRTRAMTHMGEIIRSGYRRVNEQGRLDWFNPKRISEVNVIGPDLDTEYPDRFCRT